MVVSASNDPWLYEVSGILQKYRKQRVGEDGDRERASEGQRERDICSSIEKWVGRLSRWGGWRVVTALWLAPPQKKGSIDGPPKSYRD